MPKGAIMSDVISINTSSTLDRESVFIIIQAYEDAWKFLGGSIFAAERRAQRTRETLVRCIIERVERGERDPIRLRDQALKDFGFGMA
jgi:hypothetical protein